MAFTAVTALIGGEAVTGALVLGAMAEVGTVMTIVGGVTGNKDLMKLGGVIGLVGGIGGAINGAVNAAATATAANDAVANAGAWQTADIASQATDVVSSPVTQSAIEGTQLGAAEAPALSGLDQTATQGIPGVKGFQQPANGVASEAAVTMPEANTIGPAAPTNVADAVDRKIAQSQTVATPSGPSEKGTSFFKDTWGYIKDPANKELVNSGVKLLGGMLQGANESDMFDQKMQFQKDQFNYQVGQAANISKQNQSKSGILSSAKV